MNEGEGVVERVNEGEEVVEAVSLRVGMFEGVPLADSEVVAERLGDSDPEAVTEASTLGEPEDEGVSDGVGSAE